MICESKKVNKIRKDYILLTCDLKLYIISDNSWWQKPTLSRLAPDMISWMMSDAGSDPKLLSMSRSPMLVPTRLPLAFLRYDFTGRLLAAADQQLIERALYARPSVTVVNLPDNPVPSQSRLTLIVTIGWCFRGIHWTRFACSCVIGDSIMSSSWLTLFQIC